MSRESPSRQHHLRQLVAQQAARMMAEEGISDYAFAKRKAARQLGMKDKYCLPNNSEIEIELRTHQEIFNRKEHREILRKLRETALGVMQSLSRFNPHLVGAVLEGTATHHTEIDIYLFTDSEKEVEFYLLDCKIQYIAGERIYRSGGTQHKIPVFLLEDFSFPIRLSIFAPNQIRSQPRANDGPSPRAPINALQSILDSTH